MSKKITPQMKNFRTRLKGDDVARASGRYFMPDEEVAQMQNDLLDKVVADNGLSANKADGMSKLKRRQTYGYALPKEDLQSNVDDLVAVTKLTRAVYGRIKGNTSKKIGRLRAMMPFKWRVKFDLDPKRIKKQAEVLESRLGRRHRMRMKSSAKSLESRLGRRHKMRMKSSCKELE